MTAINLHANSVRTQSVEELLYEAVRNNDLHGVKEIISHGFNKEQRIRDGRTVLMHACSQGNPEIVEYLLSVGADPKNCLQRLTPLILISNSINNNEDELLKCIELLLKYDLDKNARDKNGQTALMIAVQEGRRKIIDKLITCKCNLNVQDYEGKSALFYAVLKGKIDIVKRLVDEGVKLDLIDLEGRTAYDIASTKGLVEISSLVITPEDKEMALNEKLQKNDYKFKREPIDIIFNQLPSRNGNLHNSGFPLDVETLLIGMEMMKFRECFIKHNVQLGEFLTITEKRLKEIGVKFSVHRQHILYCIQKFHLRPWNKSSLGFKGQNGPVTLEDGILLMANTVKHLHILKATVEYIRHQIPKPIDSKIYECVEKGSEELKIADHQISQIRSIALYLEKREKLEPADLIRVNVSGNKITRTVGVLVLGVFVIGGIVWKNHKHFNFIRLKF